MRVNLTGTTERDFSAIPAGRYIAKVTDFEMRETKDKPDNKLPAGTPMINWEFTIESSTTGDTQFANRKVWMNTIIHEKVLFQLKGLLRATGAYTQEQLDGEIDFEPSDVLGATLAVVVTQREYQGEMRNDVRRVRALSEEDTAEASLLP
jgi:hypothetical protein